MKSAVALVAAAALAGMAAPVDAKCMQLELRPHVLNTVATVTPDGGGIVVGMMGAGLDDKTERTEDLPTWRIRAGKSMVPPAITTIAPGLVVYSLPTATRGSGDLVTGKRTRLGSLSRIKAEFGPLVAPRVIAIKHTDENMGRWKNVDTLVELDGTVPAGVVALVLFDSKGTAITWGVANAGAAAVRVYSSGHCDVSNGTLPPTIGDKVTLAWVGRNGRQSKATRALVVVKAAE